MVWLMQLLLLMLFYIVSCLNYKTPGMISTRTLLCFTYLLSPI